MKDVDLGEPTSFLDHVYSGCTQRECQTSKDIVDNYRSMFESRISAGATEKLLCSEKLVANSSSLSYDMEGHAKKCVERYCELANKTTQQEMTIDECHRKYCGKNKADGDGPDINCLDKFLIREPSDCVDKPGDTRSIYRET